MLRRGLSGRGTFEALGAIMLWLAVNAAIADRHARVGDLIFAGVVLLALLLSVVQRIWPAAVPLNPRRALVSLTPTVRTAPKRRAVGGVVVLILFGMVRPDSANLAVDAAYAAVFLGFILAVFHVRKQHFANAFRRLTGRARRQPGMRS